MKVKISIPSDLSSAQRQDLGELVIDFILDRTAKGLDKNNRGFTPYSKSYSASKDFKLAGKSKSRVNLKLTKEMLNELSVIDSGSGYLTVGYDGGSAADKAEWAEASDNGPSRQFLGIAPNNLNLLVEQVRLKNEAEETAKRDATARILSQLGIGNED